MSILNRIKQDALTARKNKEKFTGNKLTCLISEISIIGKNDGNRETTDEEAIKVITKFVKGVNETIKLTIDKEFTKEDLDKTDELNKELTLYNKYLPTELTESELTKHILEIMELGANNIGSIMKELKSLNLRFNGKMANEIIRKIGV